MISFDKFVARDLVERGVRLALDNPQQVITIEFNELDLYIELVLDERDRTITPSSTPCRIWLSATLSGS